MNRQINYEYLYNMVIKDIFIENTNYVYGISFIGPPGIGKSTVASIISEKLKIPVTVNDKIRRMLDGLGINASENQELVERLAYDRTRFMLENNTSMIIDANCLTAYKQVEENFNHFNAPCFFIKLECSEKEILRRIDNREIMFGRNKNNFSRAVRKDYYTYLEKLKKNPFPEEKIFFTIDTEKDLELQIEHLVNKIYKYLENMKV